jgi:hypothetical protein
MFFELANLGNKLKNKSEFFFCGKTIFLCREKDRTLTYRKLTDFVASFTYLGFLNTRLSLNPSLISISLVLKYMVISAPGFYQTWFLAFRIVIYFIRGCLIT